MLHNRLCLRFCEIFKVFVNTCSFRAWEQWVLFVWFFFNFSMLSFWLFYKSNYIQSKNTSAILKSLTLKRNLFDNIVKFAAKSKWQQLILSYLSTSQNVINHLYLGNPNDHKYMEDFANEAVICSKRICFKCILWIENILFYKLVNFLKLPLK